MERAVLEECRCEVEGNIRVYDIVQHSSMERRPRYTLKRDIMTSSPVHSTVLGARVCLERAFTFAMNTWHAVSFFNLTIVYIRTNMMEFDILNPAAPHCGSPGRTCTAVDVPGLHSDRYTWLCSAFHVPAAMNRNFARVHR
jgi:hypothetical protein